jgi:hypothetical protein
MMMTTRIALNAKVENWKTVEVDRNYERERVTSRCLHNERNSTGSGLMAAIADRKLFDGLIFGQNRFEGQCLFV